MLQLHTQYQLLGTAPVFLSILQDPAAWLLRVPGQIRFRGALVSRPVVWTFPVRRSARIPRLYFDIGEITYFNGAINAGTGADTVDFILTLNFTSPSGVSEAFTYLLSLINTLNTADPNASADIVEFPSVLPTQTFTIDGTTFTVGLEVGVVTGSGFSSQTTFSVLENASATATIRAIVTAEGVVQVSEPGTLALFSLGLLGLGLVRRRRAA